MENCPSPSKLIDCQLRIRLKDSREYEGVLTVIDPFGNMLLSKVYEISVDRLNKKNNHKREIGMVSIPKTSVESIRVSKQTFEGIIAN